MIQLTKSYINILITTKVVYITLLLIMGMMGLFIYFSEYYLDYELLVIDSNYYLMDYIFESVTLIKIVIILHSGFLVLLNKNSNKMDVILLQRVSRKNIIISKVFALIIIQVVLTTILYLLYVIIGIFLTPYMKEVDVLLLLNLQLFGLIYLVIGYYVSMRFQTSYIQLLVFVYYFLCSIFTPYMEDLSQVPFGVIIINAIGFDLYYSIASEFGFMFGSVYIFGLALLVFFAIIRTFLKEDVI